MREDELFGQARSGTFGGQFNFADDNLHPNRTGYAWSNAVLGQVRSYTESMGRVPDDRRQKTWAWYVQDTWKITPKITLDYGVRMYKWGQAIAQGGEARRSARSASIRPGAATRRCSSGRCSVGTTRVARRIRARARSCRQPSSA